MRAWVLALALASLAGCPSGSKEARFWRWFEANAPRLAQRGPDSTAAVEALRAELEKVRPGLTFDLELKEVGGGPHLLTLGAGGVREHFPAVRALVAAAPPLPGWKVVAFRQRDPGLARVELEGAAPLEGGTLSVEDVGYVAAAARPGEPVALRLFIRGFSESQRSPYSRAAYRLLVRVLGEYDTEMKLGSIDLAPFPSGPPPAALRPLRELPALVDRLFAPGPLETSGR